MSDAVDEYYAWLDKENIRLMDELITTRKALDVAIKYIKHTQKVSPFWFNILANKVLEQINEITKGGKDE